MPIRKFFPRVRYCSLYQTDRTVAQKQKGPTQEATPETRSIQIHRPNIDKSITKSMDNNCSLMWKIMGPGVAGAVFGSGWWFWVDAVVCSSVKISFLHYLPGTVLNHLPSFPTVQLSFVARVSNFDLFLKF